jgi:phytoene synthase
MKSPADLLNIPRKLQGSVGRPSSNLIPALLLLPRDRRSDALLFGAWCRLVDDIADNQSLELTQKQKALETWLLALENENDPRGELPEDFAALIRRRTLDPAHLCEIIHGMIMDTERNRYATIADLEIYCRRVASAVGLISARIFGANTSDDSGKGVRSYAEQLGIALQLTNILRDVSEDAAMGRIYLPLEDLERFGVREGEVLGSIPSPQMTHLLNHQAERANSYFAKAELAWSEMTVNQRRLMHPARFMSAIYRYLLLQMHRDRYDVFGTRYRVSGFKKLVLLLRVMTAKS